jgi:hypothetical protein
MRRGGATRCGNSGELPRTKQGTRTATCGTVSSSPPHGSPDLLHVEGEAAQREIDSGGARARVWSSGLRRCLRCGRNKHAEVQACGGGGEAYVGGQGGLDVGPRPRQRAGAGAGSARLELGLGSDVRRGMTRRTRLLAAGSGEGRRRSAGCAGLTGRNEELGRRVGRAAGLRGAAQRREVRGASPDSG